MDSFSNNTDSFNNNTDSFNTASGENAKAGSDNTIKSSNEADLPTEKRPKESKKSNWISFYTSLFLFLASCVVLILFPNNETISNITFLCGIIFIVLAMLFANKLFEKAWASYIILTSGLICFSIVLGVFKPKTIVTEMLDIIKSKAVENKSHKSADEGGSKKE